MATSDGANPHFYDELTSMDTATEDALIECICKATGIPIDDLDGDDWPLEMLIARLGEDYKRLPPLA